MDARTKAKAGSAEGAVLPSGLLLWGFPSTLGSGPKLRSQHSSAALMLHQHQPHIHARSLRALGTLLMLLSALHSLPALPGDSIQLSQKELKTQTPF